MMGSSCVYFHVLIFFPIATCMGVVVACTKNKLTLKGMEVIAPSSEIWVWCKCLSAMCRPSSGGEGWIQQVWVIESQSTVGKSKGQGKLLSCFYGCIWKLKSIFNEDILHYYHCIGSIY